MITFDNLLFIAHPHVPGAIMTQIRGLKDKGGKVISIVAGTGMYSAGKAGVRKAVDKVEDVSSFEVMVGDDEPQGWLSREDINKILTENF
ncbi:hypothetical protein N9J42_00240 [bacterium]|nr:hypothetical protein [bacterium]